MSSLRQAVALLTRFPVGKAEIGFTSGAMWFPFVGALIGMAVAAVYVSLYSWMPSLLCAVVAIAVGVWLTGALHEDGLADSLDALGSGAIGDEALEIMRDSRLGTHGTLALVISIVGRIIALGSLGPVGAAAGLVMAHSLARTGAVTLMVTTPPARPDGLGRSAASAVTVREASIAVVSGLGLATAVAGWWVIPAVTGTGLTVLVLRRLATRRIGGMTGDVLGACEQVAELLVLATVATAAWQGWSPWWAAPV